MFNLLAEGLAAPRLTETPSGLWELETLCRHCSLAVTFCLGDESPFSPAGGAGASRRAGTRQVRTTPALQKRLPPTPPLSSVRYTYPH